MLLNGSMNHWLFTLYDHGKNLQKKYATEYMAREIYLKYVGRLKYV